MSVDFPVIVSPTGLLEAGHEVLMEPVNVSQLVVVVFTSGLKEFTREEGHRFNHVPDMGPGG